MDANQKGVSGANATSKASPFESEIFLLGNLLRQHE